MCAHVHVHRHIGTPSTRQTKHLLFPDMPKDSNSDSQMSFRENGGQLRKALSMREGISARNFSWVETLKWYREDDWGFRRNQVSYAFNPPYNPGRSVSSDDQRCLFHLGRSGMLYTCPRAQSADISEFGFCSSNSAAVKPWVHYVVALPYPYLKNNVTENVYLWPITRIK